MTWAAHLRPFKSGFQVPVESLQRSVCFTFLQVLVTCFIADFCIEMHSLCKSPKQVVRPWGGGACCALKVLPARQKDNFGRVFEGTGHVVILCFNIFEFISFSRQLRKVLTLQKIDEALSCHHVHRGRLQLSVCVLILHQAKGCQCAAERLEAKANASRA